MIKTLSASKDKDYQISPHFKGWEMRSHCNGTLTTDFIKYNTVLFDLLEKLIKVLGASKAIITSGYRDSKCDKLVGGSGSGQHVEGNAVDIIFYKADGSTFNTKYVSCVAQDLGFTGIARISDQAIHLDVRTNGKYYGDEMMGHTKTVTHDFYDYFCIERDNDVKIALKKAHDLGIINNPEYWELKCKDVEYLDQLIINFTTYINSQK